MNIEQEREKLILFTKVGAIVLTSLALLATSFMVYPENRAVISDSLVHAKELPIYCVEQEKPLISISFDAAWGNDDTSSLLETLKKHNVKATFFMTGGWIEKYPDDVKAIAAGGHDLGNHSENHKHMPELSADQCKEELMKPHEKVKKLTGKDMILFRPPYGDYNDTLIQVCRENKYYPIQWDVEPYDIVESTFTSSPYTPCDKSTHHISLCHYSPPHEDPLRSQPPPSVSTLSGTPAPSPETYRTLLVPR